MAVASAVERTLPVVWVDPALRLAASVGRWLGRDLPAVRGVAVLVGMAPMLLGMEAIGMAMITTISSTTMIASA
ncbi:MAG: hypothetical protein WB713_11730, partial [Methyloceanibacter sp.]